MNKRNFILIVFITAFFSVSFSQGNWYQKPSFVMQRCLMSAFAIGSKGYIGTGNTPATGSYNDLWEYDPVTSVWTQKANLPGAIRRRAIGFSVNGKGYFGLGLDAVTNLCTNDLWEYDPVANTWVQKANFPSTGRFGAIAFSVGSKGYVGTGIELSTNQFYKDIWEYDPASNAWTPVADFGGGLRAGAMSFTVGNKAYVGLGSDSLSMYNDLWEYDPSANAWVQKAQFPGTSRCYGVGITIFNRGYAGTGLDTAGGFNDDWFEYNPANNVWTQMAMFPGGGRFHMIGFGINCRGYIGTGHWGNSTSIWFDDWYEFVPSDYYFASIISSGGNAICKGNSATLTASGGVSYSWNTGATTTSIVVSPTTSTTYTVTATTAGPLGCTSTATVAVTIKTLLISPSVVAINCGSSNGSATANVTAGGTPPYTYAWTPGGQTTQTATGLLAAGAYTVSVTDAAGCAATASVTVVALNAPLAAIGGPTVICTGQTVTLTASGGNTFSWSTGSTSTSIVINPSGTTTYSLVASVGNCHDTTTATVNVYPPPVASSSGNITICNGYPATLTASGGNNNIPYTYVWNTGATGTAVQISPITTTTYSFLVSIGNCKDSASVTVNTVPSPTAVVTGNTTLCTGDATTLTASGGNYYSWSSGQSVSQITAVPPATATYTVTVGNGVCTDDTFITVNVFPPPVAGITGTTGICDGSSASFSGTGGGTYMWSTGETTQVIHPATAGSYSVVVTIGSCTDTASVVLTVHSLPDVEASADVTIVQGQSTVLSASGAQVYVWSIPDIGQSVVVSPQYTAVFCVTGTDANNCSDTACVRVYVISCETAGELYLPNAFSPNADGENDSLQVFFGLFDCIQSFRLSVYNRWGERIYFSVDPHFRWSGIYNKGMMKSTQLPGTEVFTYYLEAVLGDNTKIARKGNISMIR